MTSIRSKLVIWLIRNRHLLKLKLKPEVVDESFSVAGFRAEVDRATARMKMPGGVRTEKLSVKDMAAEWIIPERHTEGKVLLYVHGGGFISGSCQTHRMHVAKIASGCQLKSLLFDYRLAPEHPFPAALDDCVSAYKWLLDNGCQALDIVVGGESAGGTLTLSLLLALKERNIEMPKAAFTISPLTDLRCLADSFKYNAGKDIAPLGSWDSWTKMYIAGNDPARPPLSPQMGDFSGFPPILVCVGTHEIHLDDCLNFTEKAKKQGVEVVLSKWDKMVHAFPLLAPLFPEAKNALAEICEFVKNQVRQQE